jgi:phosphoglycerate dehydrogenase-like enzyme
MDLGNISGSAIILALEPDPSAWEVRFNRCSAALIPSELVPRIGDRIVWVHSLYAGVDGVSKHMRGISPHVPLTNARGVFSHSLAEYCLAGMLYFTKQMKRLEKNREIKKWDKFVMGTLSGKTVGFLGYGSIGQATARHCIGFGMRVIVAKRSLELAPGTHPIPDELFSTESDISDFLNKSDFIVCSLPSTPSTSHFCNSNFFSRMRPNAVFISLGRGSAVDESAMVHALERKIISGAILDVFETEPLPESSRLWEMDNVLISCHNADWTGNNLIDSLKVFQQNFERFTTNQPLNNIVDRELGY